MKESHKERPRQSPWPRVMRDQKRGRESFLDSISGQFGVTSCNEIFRVAGAACRFVVRLPPLVVSPFSASDLRRDPKHTS